MRVCTRLMAAGWHLPEIKVVGGDAAQRAQAAAAIAGGSTELLGDFGFVYARWRASTQS